MIQAKTKSNFSLMTSAFRDFVSLFFPDYCLSCSRSLVKGEDALCTFCLHELPKTGYYQQHENPVTLKFKGRIPLKHGWASLKFRKEGIVQNLLHQLKYNNQPEIGLRFGKIFGGEICSAGLQNEFDLIVPVPLHKAKLKKRGYNQSAKFAEGINSVTGIPVLDHISIKLIQTDTQTKKNRRERWENVKQSFDIVSSQPILGKRILLVDDVVTTGATLEACGKVLLEKGCKELSIGCIAEAQ